MSRLPKGWEAEQLGNLADFVMGQAPPGTECNKAGTGVPFVKAGEFGDRFPVIREWTSRPLKCALASDVLICVVGATAGKINLGANCAIGRSVAAIRPTPALDQIYLYNFLATKVLQLRAGSVGSAQGVISKDDLAEVQIPLAPLPEQRRIVAKIDSLTAKSRRARDHLDHIPRLVEKYKQAVLAAAFNGSLCGREPLSFAAMREFIESLDQGWSPKCESEPGGPDEWAVIKTTAIQPIEFLPAENKRLPQHLTPRPELAIRSGDVLITRAGPRSRVAISCFVSEDHPKTMLCDKAYRLRVDRDIIDPQFLTYMLNSPQSLNALEAMKTGISDSGLNLTQNKFLSLPIPVLSIDEQHEIADKVRSMVIWIERLATEATSARKLIDRLDQAVLAKAFRGELVPQDPADEPASVLLERIRAERGAAPKAQRGRRPAMEA